MNTAPFSVSTRLCFPKPTLYSLLLLHVDIRTRRSVGLAHFKRSHFCMLKNHPSHQYTQYCIMRTSHELLGLHSLIPDTVSSSEDPLVRDQSASTSVSPLAPAVVLQGNLKRTHEHNQLSLSFYFLDSQRPRCLLLLLFSVLSFLSLL